MFINMVLDALVTSVTNAFSFDKFLKFNKNTIIMNFIYSKILHGDVEMLARKDKTLGFMVSWVMEFLTCGFKISLILPKKMNGLPGN